MGEVIYPQGLLTKWSTLICFPSIRKRRQNSQLFSKVLVHRCPRFLCAQSVFAMLHNFLGGFSLFPLHSSFISKQISYRGSKGKRLSSNSPSPPFGFFYYFLSSALQFASCKITHSAALLIGSGEASSRFKWKCRVCPEWSNAIWWARPAWKCSPFNASLKIVNEMTARQQNIMNF